MFLSGTLLSGVTATLSTSYAIFGKTRFVLYLGAVYIAFHHWDFKPYKREKFAAGAPGSTASLVQGGREQQVTA